MANARNATATDFDAMAERHAKAFWLWLLVAGLTWWLASMWWAIIPAILATTCAVAAIGSTRAAFALRNGTYAVPNPNNGAPDGDAQNCGNPTPGI